MTGAVTVTAGQTGNLHRSTGRFSANGTIYIRQIQRETGNRSVENLFEQMGAGLVTRQVGSASDAPTRGIAAAVAGGTPRHIGSSGACRRQVPLDGEPGRILGLDSGSTRVAGRDTGRGGRTLMARHGPENRSDRSRPQKPISRDGVTRCTQPGRLIAFRGRTRTGMRGFSWNHLGARHVGGDRGLVPERPRAPRGHLEPVRRPQPCTRAYARGGAGVSGGVSATTGRCM